MIESSQEEEEDEEDDDGGTSYQFENELENPALDSQANEEEEPDSYVLVQVSISFVVFKLQLYPLNATTYLRHFITVPVFQIMAHSVQLHITQWSSN